MCQSLHNSTVLPAAKKNIPRTIGISNLVEEGSPLLSILTLDAVICQPFSVRRPSKKKKISDFQDLNQGPKSRLQSSRHYTTIPPPFFRRHKYYIPTYLQARCVSCRVSFDQLGCVRLPRPVRVHRLPQKLGLRVAAPIVRVECGRGVG